MSNSFTPAPWVNEGGLVNGRESRSRFKQFGDDTPSIDIFDANEWPRDMYDEAMANADLIAAAPDLLMAAKDMMQAIAMRSIESFAWHSERAQKLRAAIAKATGEKP